MHSRNRLSRSLCNWNHFDCISKLWQVSKHVLCRERSVSRPKHNPAFYYENIMFLNLEDQFTAEQAEESPFKAEK